MKLDISISPGLHEATRQEAKRLGLTQSAVIRHRLNVAFGVREAQGLRTSQARTFSEESRCQKVQ